MLAPQCTGVGLVQGHLSQQTLHRAVPLLPHGCALVNPCLALSDAPLPASTDCSSLSAVTDDGESSLYPSRLGMVSAVVPTARLL